jgi:hypothetical protein
MYFEILAPGNTEFVDGIHRSFGWKSGRLDLVVSAVEAAQKVPSQATLLALLNQMHAWRTQHPQEFANRGATNGIAYRVWMEAKQMLHNRHGQVFHRPDPPMPPGCPGVQLCGVYVPEGEGHAEICHGFAYRWAVAAGRIPLSPLLPARRPHAAFNAENSTPVLYPFGYGGYQPARAGGVMLTQPRDIVGMFAVNPPGAPVLGHSLIAETATVWYSANNTGTFAVGTGRSRIDTAGHFPVFAGNQVGWVGNGSLWRRPDGIILNVIRR